MARYHEERAASETYACSLLGTKKVGLRPDTDILRHALLLGSEH